MKRNVKRKTPKPANAGGGAAQKSKVVSLPRATNRTRSGTKREVHMFRNSERIMDINGSVACTNQASLAVNAGLVGTFPWLAGIASKYDKYRLHQLEFEYVPVRGTSVSGEVGMVFDPDTLDPPPGTMAELLQSEKAVSGAPWREIHLRVGKSDLLFTRSGHPTAVSVDLKTYDVGRIHILTCGMADTSQVGYLMVHYAVELVSPQLTEPADPAGLFPHMAEYYLTANYDMTAHDDTNYHVLPATLFTKVYDTIGCGQTANGFTFPPGVYKVTLFAATNVVTTATTGNATSKVRLHASDSGGTQSSALLSNLNTDNANTSDTLNTSATSWVTVYATSTNAAVCHADVYYDAGALGSDASAVLLGSGTTTWTKMLIERIAILDA